MYFFFSIKLRIVQPIYPSVVSDRFQLTYLQAVVFFCPFAVNPRLVLPMPLRKNTALVLFLVTKTACNSSPRLVLNYKNLLFTWIFWINLLPFTRRADKLQYCRLCVLFIDLFRVNYRIKFTSRINKQVGCISASASRKQKWDNGRARRNTPAC